MKMTAISRPQHQCGEPPWPADGTYWVQMNKWNTKTPKNWEGKNWIKLSDAIKLLKVYHYLLVCIVGLKLEIQINEQPRLQYERHIFSTKKEKKRYTKIGEQNMGDTKYKNYINIQRLFRQIWVDDSKCLKVWKATRIRNWKSWRLTRSLIKGWPHQTFTNRTGSVLFIYKNSKFFSWQLSFHTMQLTMGPM